jgi:hypothetical protein
MYHLELVDNNNYRPLKIKHLLYSKDMYKDRVSEILSQFREIENTI